LRRSKSQLAALVDFDTELERTRTRDEAAAVLAKHACDRLGFGRAAVLVRRTDDQWWALVVDDDRDREWQPCDPPGRGVDDALRARIPKLVPDLAGEPVGALLDGSNIVLAPICADDEDLGVLVAEWGGRPAARIPTMTVRTLHQAAQRAGLALRHRALLDEVERLATRDALTGLANRRLLEETLDRELGRVRRNNSSLTAMVLDIDYFKNVNDEHGHLVGDTVLREVAAALDAHVKAYDLVARFGGDEFVVLLPGCESGDAASVAERLRLAVHEGVTAAPITTSAGLATIPDHAMDGERLLAAADAALYTAKRSGRDRAVVSDRWIDDRSVDDLAV
jgi:diguanylate cyclase (GGDEF)-like protein